MSKTNAELAYVRIASHAFGVPLLLAEQQGLVIGEFLAGRMSDCDSKASRFLGGDQQAEETEHGPKWKGYRRDGNVATLNIHGELVNRGAWLGASSGLTSYEGIGEQLRQVSGDDEVSKIILDINSPGGEATYMPETARAIRALSETKEVVAYVNGMAASAAYGLASGASRIVMAASASVGSIGVLVLHFDQSDRLKNMGVKTTLIHAGAHKVDGHPFGPLEGSALANIKNRIEHVMTSFVGVVADHRIDLNEENIRGLEARILLGPEALEAGLADEFGTYEGLLESLKSARGGQVSQTRSNSMVEKSTGSESTSISQAQLDAAVEKATVAGKAEGEKEGLAAAIGRLKAVLSAEGIKGNPARVEACFDLACKAPDMAAADVVAFAKSHTPEATNQKAESVPSANLTDRMSTDTTDDLPVADEGTDKDAAVNDWGGAKAAAGIAA